MPIWKLEPVAPDGFNRDASTYYGPVYVRAAEEIAARGLAASSYPMATEKPPGEILPVPPWTDTQMATCTKDEDSEYDEDGPEAIVGPEEALAAAYPQI